MITPWVMNCAGLVCDSVDFGGGKRETGDSYCVAITPDLFVYPFSPRFIGAVIYGSDFFLLFMAYFTVY